MIEVYIPGRGVVLCELAPKSAEARSASASDGKPRKSHAQVFLDKAKKRGDEKAAEYWAGRLGGKGKKKSKKGAGGKADKVRKAKAKAKKAKGKAKASGGGGGGSGGAAGAGAGKGSSGGGGGGAGEPEETPDAKDQRQTGEKASFMDALTSGFKKGQGAARFFRELPKNTKRMFTDSDYRKEISSKALNKAGRAAKAAAQVVKHEAEEFKHAGKAVAKISRGEALDAHDSQALKAAGKSLGKLVIGSILLGTGVGAAGGGLAGAASGAASSLGLSHLGAHFGAEMALKASAAALVAHDRRMRLGRYLTEAESEADLTRMWAENLAKLITTEIGKLGDATSEDMAQILVDMKDSGAFSGTPHDIDHQQGEEGDEEEEEDHGYPESPEDAPEDEEDDDVEEPEEPESDEPEDDEEDEPSRTAGYADRSRKDDAPKAGRTMQQDLHRMVRKLSKKYGLPRDTGERPPKQSAPAEEQVGMAKLEEEIRGLQGLLGRENWKLDRGGKPHRIVQEAEAFMGRTGWSLPTIAEGMRRGTEADLKKVLAKARWPEPRRMHTKNTMDLIYSDRGTEIANVSVMMRRGKEVSRSILINTSYL